MIPSYPLSYLPIPEHCSRKGRIASVLRLAILRALLICIGLMLPSIVRATILPAPTVTGSSVPYAGTYLGSWAADQADSEFLTTQGVGTFLEFDLGGVRSVDGFVNVTLVDPGRQIGANRLIFDTDGTPGFNAATDTVRSFTQAQTGSLGQGIIQRFDVVSARYARWEVQAVVAAPTLVGMTEVAFLGTENGSNALSSSAVTVIGSAPAYSAQFAAANASNGVAGRSILGGASGIEYASNGAGANTYVDFDLGSSRPILGFDLFDRLNPGERTTSFDLIFSNSPTFSTVVATKSYSKATEWTASDKFEAVNARYVRYDVTSGGSYAGLGEMTFYVPAPPTVSSLSPINGTTSGLTPVTLTGTDFTGATDVTFGGAAATNVVVVNATTITCVTPPHAAGAVSVIVTTPYGSNAANTLYTYLMPSQAATTRVLAWGNNEYGKLGNNSTTDSLVPVEVTATGALAGKTVIAVDTSMYHSLALCSDGTVAAWGRNLEGQLGNNSTANSAVPVAVATTGVLTGKTVIAIAAADLHSLALCSDGTLVAWGANAYGQLGNNSTMYSLVPVAVTTTGVLAGKTVSAIAAGYYQSLALCSDGTVAAWGHNQYGQLGNGSTTSSIVPVAVTTTGALAGKTVIAIAAGEVHNLALCSDGTLAAWGVNFSGQLGNNSAAGSNVPVAVITTGLAGRAVVAISAGVQHSLALCSDGTLALWGNSYGASSTIPAIMTATGVLAGKTVIAAAAGWGHSLALCSDGTLAAWGWNFHGKLGNNSTTDSPVPVLVSTASLAAGERFVSLGLSETSDHNLALVASLAPEITAIAPASGSRVGGTTVTLTGLRFNGTTLVTFDGTAATSVNVVNDTTLTCITPAHAVGTAHVEVTTPAGTGNREDFYTYINPAPTNLAIDFSSIEENSPTNSRVGVLSATDDLGDTHSFSLVAGTGSTDNASFLIQANDDRLRIIPIADFETKNSYDIRVRATDTDGGSVEKRFTISISNVNEMPSFTKGANQSNPVTTSAQSVPGWATAINDGDSTVVQGLTFNITANTNPGMFTTGPAISSTGTLTYTPAGIVGTATITVTLTDDATINGNAALTTAAQTFTITFTNPAPTNIILSAYSIAENNSANATVGTMTATDNVGDTNTFSLVPGSGSTDNASFTIAGTALRLTPSADFETKNSYDILLRATDSAGGFVEKALTITITNVNEMPSFTKGADQTIPVTTSAQSVAGWATAINDGDSTVVQGLTFNITGNTNPGLFTTSPAINSAGTLTYTPAGIAGTATITVTLTDDTTINGTAALTTTQTFSVTVIDPRPVVAVDWNTPQSSQVITLINFTGSTGTNLGGYPSGSFIQASDGALYATTRYGGASEAGTIFKMDTTGLQTNLAQFSYVDPPDFGGEPRGSLLQGSDGNLYATLSNLAAYYEEAHQDDIDNYGSGKVVKITPSGVVTTMVALFRYEGAVPLGTLIQGNDGSYYGTASDGSPSRLGSIFKITSAGVLTNVVNFTGINGANPGARPQGSLIQGNNNAFYGTTAVGGANNLGTIFKVTPAGAFTTLVSFTGTSGASLGAHPHGDLLQVSGGDFYGMTTLGGTNNLGTVFKMTASGVITTLVNFTGIGGANPGSLPRGSLVLGSDGLLYGLTTNGGANDFGTAFKMTTAGVLTTLVNFTGTSGANPGSYPHGNLFQANDGAFYGTTYEGGTNNLGTAFKLTPGVTTPEGSAATQTGTFSDPNGNGTVTLTASSGTITQNNATGTWSWTATGSDGPATSTVTITATDSTGNIAMAPFTFSVTNVPPTVVITAPATASDCSGVNFGFTATDLATADQAAGFLWSINYGDGSNPVFLNAGTASPLSFSHNFTVPGTYIVRATAMDKNSGVSVQATKSITITCPLADWRLLHFGSAANSGNGANTNDADHDGLANLIEYAFGLNPNSGSSLQTPPALLIGGNLVSTFTEPSAMGCITYEAEWSTDLIQWFPIPDTGAGNTHIFSVPVGNNPKMFLRHRITEN